VQILHWKGEDKPEEERCFGEHSKGEKSGACVKTGGKRIRNIMPIGGTEHQKKKKKTTP